MLKSYFLNRLNNNYRSIIRRCLMWIDPIIIMIDDCHTRSVQTLLSFGILLDYIVALQLIPIKIVAKATTWQIQYSCIWDLKGYLYCIYIYILIAFAYYDAFIMNTPGLNLFWCQCSNDEAYLGVKVSGTAPTKYCFSLDQLLAETMDKVSLETLLLLFLCYCLCFTWLIWVIKCILWSITSWWTVFNYWQTRIYSMLGY